MKAIFVVSSLLASAFASNGATAASYWSDPRDDYRAQGLGTEAPVSRPFRSGNECGPDRASSVWGAGGRLLGYICDSNVNGN
jgi:hypothetical protein